MEVIGDKILLRRFRATDTLELFDLIDDREVEKYLPGVCVTSVAEMAGYVDIYVKANFVDDIYLAIVDKATQSIVGALICTRVRFREMEMAYFISRTRRREGLMFEALMEFVKWYQNQNIGNLLVFEIAKENSASLCLIKKLRDCGVNICLGAISKSSIWYVIRPC